MDLIGSFPGGGSDSCISFVMRSPIFKGNVDTVEEIQLTGFCKKKILFIFFFQVKA